MNNIVNSIIALTIDCSHICEQLQECLAVERTLLIQFKTEELLQNNIQKEILLTSLLEKRRFLRDLLKFHFGLEDASLFEERLKEPHRTEWKIARLKWAHAWEQTRVACERNQEFIEHSMRNLGQIADNLKKLFGDQSLYSAKGTIQGTSSAGKVVEATY